jgi:hypothetical protein
MKKVLFASFVVVLATLMLQSCLKDNCTRTYTIYTPVYKTSAEVRANIKSSASRQIQNPGKLVVLGNYIFLNEIDKGIHIIDNANPSAPVNRYFIDIPGNIDIAIKGNNVYADLYTDLLTLDISNPASIKVSKIIDDVFENRRYINFNADTNLVIVDWLKKDTTVTMECATADNYMGRGGVFMTLSSSSGGAASSAIGVAGSMARFTLLNDYLYTVTENALNVFNITSPANPTFSNKVNIGWGIETIYPFNNNLFLGSTNGMFVYGTVNPATPNRISTFSHALACDPVIADGNFAYVTLRSGNTCGGANNQLDVINIQNITAPLLVKSYPLTSPRGLAKSGNSLFICDGTAGFKVYNAADVNNLTLLKTVGNINAYDVIALNNIAIVVGKDGLYQFNVLDPSNTSLLSKVPIQR